LTSIITSDRVII
jgi:hypothetical protein